MNPRRLLRVLSAWKISRISLGELRWLQLLLIRFAMMLCFVALLPSCSSVGPRSIPPDRFNYNKAISQSRDEQMLLNIVRLRYHDMPDFLAVSSVITSYSFEGGMGIRGERGFSNAADIIGADANILFAERPTITFTPLSGEEFSRRLLTPLTVESMFHLGQAGWPVDLLLTIGIQRMNDVENMSFSHVPAPGDVDMVRQIERDHDNLKRFQKVLRLILELTEQEALEVLRSENDSSGALVYRFATNGSPEVRHRITELKHELDLDTDLDTFRITTRTTGRQPDEITIQTRSLLAIMSFLSRGISVPEIDLQRGLVIKAASDMYKDDATIHGIPLRIHSQKNLPDDPYVAVKYRDYWFYIDHSDIQSKRTFGTMLMLFQLQAPSGGGAAPLLTLPTGP